MASSDNPGPNPTAWLPVALFAAGVALILASVATGQADVRVFALFPVFSGTSSLFLIGVLLVVLSFLAGFAVIMKGESGEPRSSAGVPEPLDAQAPPEDVSGGQKRRTEFGGLVLVGPIPIAFGSNRSIAILMLIAGTVLVVALVVLALLGL